MNSWLEKARETQKFHFSQRKVHPKWRLSDTAKQLKRSCGSVSEDLLIAKWYRKDHELLERFEFAKDAITFLRMKEDELEKEEVE